MRLTVLGSSGSGPTRTNPASGHLVEADGSTMWLDAGTGTFMALASRVDPASLSAVVVSHIHADHCADLFGLYGYLAYGPPAGSVSVPVYVPDGAAWHLASFARAELDHVFHRVFDFVTVGAGDTATVGAASLRFGSAVHGVAALVTRIEAGGRSITYSGDTGPGGDLAELAVECDVAVVEATLAGDRRHDETPHHLTASEAGAVAAAAGSRRLILTHLAPTLDGEASAAEAAETYGGPVTLAVPGLAVTV